MNPRGELMLKLILAIGMASATVVQAQPIITNVENAAGPPNCAGCTLLYAPNTWYTIYGTNLSTITGAWKASDFINGQMPTTLNGVSVQVLYDNQGIPMTEPAYISYTSPTQINILTPPEAIPIWTEEYGYAVNLEINGGSFAGGFLWPQTLPAVAPNFFLYSGTSYVIAEHADGSLIGPTTLYPGYTTPARPGETIVLYAEGLGPVSGTIQPGSMYQSGTMLQTFEFYFLPASDSLTQSANPTVKFAGLISPGLYQINIVVPSLGPGVNQIQSGDNQIAILVGAEYNVAWSNSPVYITVAAQ
jgi:uncharacterized protein (TIGR03437 family)